MMDNESAVEIFELEVTPEDSQKYKRLDLFLTDKVPDLSRNVIKNLFLKENIFAFDCKLELKKMPPAGTKITIRFPELIPSKAAAENIPLEILFEDEHLVFVNKPQAMVTHPAPGNYTGTLVNAILHHCPDIKGIGDEKRPGIVHRLDKGTSGVMVLAKTHKCHQGLIELFSKHDLTRKYECLAMGIKMPSAGKLEGNIGRHPNNRLKMAILPEPKGKKAITFYKVLNFFEKCSHIECKLETGRTHQIRVHLSTLLKAPLLCDSLYGNPKEHINRLGGKFANILKDWEHPFLHAKHLSLVHPITKEELSFEAPAPLKFQEVLKLLGQNND